MNSSQSLARSPAAQQCVSRPARTRVAAAGGKIAFLFSLHCGRGSCVSVILLSFPHTRFFSSVASYRATSLGLPPAAGLPTLATCTISTSPSTPSTPKSTAGCRRCGDGACHFGNSWPLRWMSRISQCQHLSAASTWMGVCALYAGIVFKNAGGVFKFIGRCRLVVPSTSSLSLHGYSLSCVLNRVTHGLQSIRQCTWSPWTNATPGSEQSRPGM